MANPTVEKLKVFGLRHGEKLAMGTVALIFFFCAYSAWVHPTIPITPEEVEKTAKEAKGNLSRRQDPASIATNLATAGVKPQGFEKKVDALQAGVADVAKYKLDKPFVIPEPGAGLIRDMPELLAPSKLYVHTGRGAVRVFALDDERKLKLKVDDDAKKGGNRTAKPKAPRGAGLGLGGLGGGTAKKPKGGSLAEAEKQKEDEDAERRKKNAIAGIEDVANKDEVKPADDDATTPADKYETKLRGYRFVTAVGTFPHKLQKDLFAKALKIDAASATPQYLRLDIERQELNGDNSWGDWTKVVRSANEELLDIRTKKEDEIVPDEARIETLVDPLPFLEVGYWVGAHPAALVPKELLAPKAAAGTEKDGTASGKGNMNKMGGGNAGMTAKDYEKRAGGGPGGGGAGYGAGMKASGAMGGGQMNFGQTPKGASGTPAAGDFEKSGSDAIMVRALDFDVKPDATYRYRVRVVFANPNLGWESVGPGVDARTKELNGPWSPVTAEVGIPADIATYATGKTPAVPGMPSEAIHFEVVAWNELDGLTLVKSFEEAPGQIIGAKENITLPDEKGSKTRQIDFTSRQVLADTVGGTRPAADIQAFGTTRMEVPILALVVRADGMLILRDQAKDAASGEMAEMKAIFEQIKSDGASKSKKTNSTLGGALGAMGGGGLQGAD